MTFWPEEIRAGDVSYGVVSNEELVDEIEKLTFDHGETKVCVEKRDRALTKCKQTVQRQEMLRCASKH
ncbi:MAG: hypothetical protein ACP5VS_15350 [Desulfomonilaceae bacterium]